MNSRSKLLALVALLFLFPVLMLPAPALRIRVSGRWILKLDGTDLTGGAGTDFPATFQSAVDQVTLTISNAVASWNIDVRRIDVNWDAGFSLEANHGGGYQTVTTTDASFLTGSGDTAVDVQFQFGGISVTDPLDDYVTTVVWTVTDT